VGERGFRVDGFTSIAEWAKATGQETVAGRLAGLFADTALPRSGPALLTSPADLHRLLDYQLREGSPAAGATIAWLTASAEVTNTFTVGKIAITLAETGWTNYSKIYPGAVINKNPTVTVTANSEDCYVYVMVDNQLNATLANAVTLNISSNWTLVGSNGSMTVYRYINTSTQNRVKFSATATVLPEVFTTVTVDSTVVTEANINGLKDKTIVIKAYAHQSGATTEGDADTAALAHFGM
jgi:predicted ribosomally synthesized peptide with SipW-like signal peptide